MVTYKEVGEKITNMIISAIEKGEQLPWVKPWKGGFNPIAMGAVSYTTGRPYSFINQIMLGCDGEWITFNKCKELGGKVKKGAKAKMVYFAKTVTKETTDADGKKHIAVFPIFQSYMVFNIKDCERLESKWKKDAPKETPKVVVEENADAEEVIKNYIALSGITFHNDINSNRAFYSPTEDKVIVPNKEQFKVMNEYYSTTFHELVHSTLKENRCNRPQDENGLRACFGNAPYAKEELVAELGACMMLAMLGISTETTERNSTAYLQSWLKALKEDKGMIVWAGSRAEKAVRFIKEGKLDEVKGVA